uniref:Secreted protein n=1 Tax=Setaria viridis TaxID=4556 RepID=A0A4U6VV38_SETVI|nr:hypothetical protein SEVIR_2G221266v2 [Setaria viridis]
MATKLLAHLCTVALPPLSIISSANVSSQLAFLDVFGLRNEVIHSLLIPHFFFSSLRSRNVLIHHCLILYKLV